MGMFELIQVFNKTPEGIVFQEKPVLLVAKHHLSCDMTNMEMRLLDIMHFECSNKHCREY